jgi:DNA invertase Pin-like site-specific DNA recombinase
MVYGYIRVSTEKQTVENQRFEIERYCSKNNMVIDHWIEETISGTKIPEKRLLGSLLAEAKTGDLIVCSELSRLGRNMLMIMSILNNLLLNGIKIWTIKDNCRLEDDIQAKILAFAFGLSAEIERNLISQRTKEALARKKSEGFVPGRPSGSKPAMQKLSEHDEEIQSLLAANISKTAIARRFGVCRKTLYSYLKNRQGNA